MGYILISFTDSQPVPIYIARSIKINLMLYSLPTNNLFINQQPSAGYNQLPFNNLQLYSTANPSTTNPVQEDTIYITAIEPISTESDTTTTTLPTQTNAEYSPQEIMATLMPLLYMGGLQQSQQLPNLNNTFTWENMSLMNLMGNPNSLVNQYQEYSIPTMMPFGLTIDNHIQPQMPSMQYLPFNISHTEYINPMHCFPQPEPKPKPAVINNINTNNLDNHNNNRHIRDSSGNSSLLDFDLDLF